MLVVHGKFSDLNQNWKIRIEKLFLEFGFLITDLNENFQWAT